MAAVTYREASWLLFGLVLGGGGGLVLGVVLALRGICAAHGAGC